MAATLNELTARINTFRDERDWRQFHTLKNLFVSLNLEASELLELAQWKTDDDVSRLRDDPEFRKRAGEECADIVIYLLLIADELGLDLLGEVDRKIELNNERYPSIAEDYAKTFRFLRSLDVDVFLAQHPSMYGMDEKRQARMDGAKKNPFINPKEYRAFVKGEEAKYLKQLARERRGK